jgi:hypothetical protein
VVTVQPALERPWGARLSIDGLVGERIAATRRQWIETVPTTDPAVLQMFRDRDVPHPGGAPPSWALLPWSGEFAGKYLIAAAQFVALTGDRALQATVAAFATEMIACQDADGYLGPFEHDARLFGTDDNRVWTNWFPAIDRPDQWQGWQALGDNVYPPGSTITALSTVPGGTSLHVLGFDNKVWTNWFPAINHPDQWQGWQALTVFRRYISWLPAPAGLLPVAFSRDAPMRTV